MEPEGKKIRISKTYEENDDGQHLVNLLTIFCYDDMQF